MKLPSKYKNYFQISFTEVWAVRFPRAFTDVCFCDLFSFKQNKFSVKITFCCLLFSSTININKPPAALALPLGSIPEQDIPSTMHQVSVNDALSQNLFVEQLAGEEHNESCHGFQRNAVCNISAEKTENYRD